MATRRGKRNAKETPPRSHHKKKRVYLCTHASGKQWCTACDSCKRCKAPPRPDLPNDKQCQAHTVATSTRIRKKSINGLEYCMPTVTPHKSGRPKRTTYDDTVGKIQQTTAEDAQVEADEKLQAELAAIKSEMKVENAKTVQCIREESEAEALKLLIQTNGKDVELPAEFFIESLKLRAEILRI
ncbi:unnamed protein product [Cylindrotheca closterium]|uniref:Uncharacterized protein n=1 Tax=Cylindrotheca closterium TaxID=2856 RepID=A0AAD2FQ06_9STRA|nr:unnamed protein product [Cylindrotheca closterium]CAJ1950453.1 unnamed protein product [Cylindrotheca closterium]CAJ1963952.1 unnamed protein product [Cylindrotheca closterium]